MSNVLEVLPPSHDAAVYTVPEVARLLRLSIGITYMLVREGEIPARRMGARWVIPKERFHTWLNSDPLDGAAGWP
jgi:excisionase family DNA binding protein